MFSEIVQTGIRYDGSHPIRVALKALRRGTLLRIQVVQLAGTLAGFTCAFYNKFEACPTDGTAPIPERLLYRVTRQYTVAAAASAMADADAYNFFGLPYSNVDAGSTNAPAILYLEIIPTGGTATSVFGVALCIQAAIVD